MIKNRKVLVSALSIAFFILLVTVFSVSVLVNENREKTVADSSTLQMARVQEAAAREDTYAAGEVSVKDNDDNEDTASQEIAENTQATSVQAAATASTAEQLPKITSRGTTSAAKPATKTAAASNTNTSKTVSQVTTPAKSTPAPAKSGAQALDWWTKAQYVFARGAVAKVTDVYTGKTFNIKRTYGTNHADCEALTSRDSDIIKSIWGGWSWVRRPVVVEVNGTRIAASMAAMPHAGLDSYPAVEVVNNRSGNYGTGQNLDEVKGNGMDGHFDIHFLNSRTHGTNRVDPQHQAAIKKAIGK